MARPTIAASAVALAIAAVIGSADAAELGLKDPDGSVRVGKRHIRHVRVLQEEIGPCWRRPRAFYDMSDPTFDWMVPLCYYR